MKSEKAKNFLNGAIAEAREMFPMVHINSFKTDYGISVQAVELAEQEMQEKAIEAYCFNCQFEGKLMKCNSIKCDAFNDFINQLNN